MWTRIISITIFPLPFRDICVKRRIFSALRLTARTRNNQSFDPTLATNTSVLAATDSSLRRPIRQTAESTRKPVPRRSSSTPTCLFTPSVPAVIGELICEARFSAKTQKRDLILNVLSIKYRPNVCCGNRQ